MELRKDPITQTWVILDTSDTEHFENGDCPLCPEHELMTGEPIYSYPYNSVNWQVRVIPHLRPLYRIEGDANRRAEGIYDKMRNLGAHEIVVETPQHSLTLSQQSDENLAQVLRAYVSRLGDLKKDRRFRYITVFRNQGAQAGQDLEHPHSQITATPFIPRRVGYELRSAQRYFKLKERCLICDVSRQEISQGLRTVEQSDEFLAFCPFASRVPYETWVLPVDHHCAFEEDLGAWERQLQFARFLKSVLQRLESVSSSYHLVLHTTPNLGAKYERGGNWQSIGEDYHWHFEILPVVASKYKSYSLKEVYYISLSPEDAAKELREVNTPALHRG